jgi:alcohol dehydrogenase YqhD (iron-dependent ADH family)
MKTKLSGYGISAQDAAAKVSDRLRSRGLKLGEHQAIDADGVREILLASG